ncbi:hypothetical protein LG294_00100 [Glutamicibacter arilaitensis]
MQRSRLEPWGGLRDFITSHQSCFPRASDFIGWLTAVKEIPTGTASAVWVGIGASLMVICSTGTGQGAFSALRVLFMWV